MEVPHIQFINGECSALRTGIETPRVQFLDKLNIDIVVDVPVIMQRRSLHALSTEAFGRIFHMFYVLALFS